MFSLRDSALRFCLSYLANLLHSFGLKVKTRRNCTLAAEIQNTNIWQKFASIRKCRNSIDNDALS